MSAPGSQIAVPGPSEQHRGATLLSGLFNPGGVAVVGASRDRAKLGAVMARSLSGFPGPVALVNPRDGGMAPSVAAAAAEHGAIDLAVLCVPAAVTASALAEAAAGGVRAAVVCGGGFAEAGPEGERHQAALARVAGETGVRVLGPNTSGFLVPGRALTATFVPGAADVPAGRVAVVAASGGVNHALAFLLAEAGHGVSLAVGLGNAVDVGAPDVLDHLADDPATTAVALHVESVADGPRLLEAVYRLTARKPVVALVVGRHDVGAFAQSHTGALATSWRTTRAALRQAGAVLVGSERELVDAVAALSLVRLPAGASGVGVLTAQAGPGLLLLDDLRGRGIDIPELTPPTQAAVGELLPPLTYQRNPVDTGRPGPEFGGVLRAVAADPAVDVVAGYALHEPDALDLAAAVDAADAQVPLVVGMGGSGPEVTAARHALLARGIPTMSDPTGVATAVAALLSDAGRGLHGWLQGGHTAVSLQDGHLADAGAELGVGPWDEDAAKRVVAALGVAVPARRACAGRDAAHRALAELGGPVAVKLLDAAVLHKTEVGGVRLGVRTPAELDEALDAIGADRVLVEGMASPGVDLVVGARRDPVFGPVVLVGLGGTVAEALADVAVRVAPISPDAAAGMADELAGRALLDGWRGGPVLDRAALGRFVAALGALLHAHPHLQDVEVNPLRVTADGLIALDAVITADTEVS
ncbi:acetate--CoA ligase family protein [Pseudonocardia sp. DSM 110487]|uniref:acetate--CoA ligase family protein n=1 Tax=Pseudonocardia sp. DSM 110487 TaxID=2865833 RepID=UPI001C6985F9|nr:acetate--CoA ligase family protein [Pseudonocardia sp. DSM 110487]QYN32727.1 acetate--CoA ligase family protein [Pseudonocardia sp. DSM 110487]